MSTLTTRLALYLPASDGSENYNVVTDLINNLNKLDAAVGSTPVTSSTRPASAYNGQWIRETDTGRVYVSNGTLPGSASFIFQPFMVGTRAIITGANARTLRLAQNGDTEDRFLVDSDGDLWWSAGSGTIDTTLYRSAAGVLKTDGGLVVGGALSVLGIGETIYVERTSDLTRVNNTLTDDPQLTATLGASATYDITVMAIVSGTSGDFASSWTVPASATGSRHCVGPELASTSFTSTLMRSSAHGLTTSVNYGMNSASGASVQERGIVKTGASGGTWAYKWAENTTNAAGTTLGTNSYAIIRRVA